MPKKRPRIAIRPHPTLEKAIETAIIAYLNESMDYHNGDIPAVARESGRHRVGIYKILRRYGIKLGSRNPNHEVPPDRIAIMTTPLGSRRN